MPDKALPTEQILSMLESGPPRLTAATNGLTEQQLHTPPARAEWSANEVLAHMRSCADVWGECMVTILEQEAPTIRAINPRTWIERTDYLDLDFHSSLQAFTVQRTKLLQFLNGIKPTDWSRAATITGAGKPIVRTVHSYAQWLATHERPHLKQIERMVKAMRAIK